MLRGAGVHILVGSARWHLLVGAGSGERGGPSLKQVNAQEDQAGQAGVGPSWRSAAGMEAGVFFQFQEQVTRLRTTVLTCIMWNV